MRLSRRLYDSYSKELDDLHPALKEVQQAVQDARSEGDLSENEEYSTALNRQKVIEHKIAVLEDRLDGCEVVEAGFSNNIDVGSVVKVTRLAEDGKPIGEPRTFNVEEIGDTVVMNILSLKSPLGKAIEGKSTGTYYLPIQGGIEYYVEHVK